MWGLGNLYSIVETIRKEDLKCQSLFMKTALESDCSYTNVLEMREPLMDNRELDCNRMSIPFYHINQVNKSVKYILFWYFSLKLCKTF